MIRPEHHFIRHNLQQVWLKYLPKLDDKLPLRISPFEVIDLRLRATHYKVITYYDLMEEDSVMGKLKEQGKRPIEMDWFQYLQIQNLFETDKRKYGFRSQNSDMEEIVLK